MLIINNLNDLKKVIKYSTYISLLIICCLFLILSNVYYSKYVHNRNALMESQIRESMHVYESALSEKLSIIASSDIFINYLRSGEVTRKTMYPDFVRQLGLLNSNAVVGMRISDLNNDLLFARGRLSSQGLAFQYGTISDTALNLKLCYLNNTLQKETGTCKYVWTLYLNLNEIINELQRVHPDIKKCGSCKAIDLFKKDSFGSFSSENVGPITAKVKIVTQEEYLFFVFELLIILLLLIFVIWNKYWIEHIIEHYLTLPLLNIANQLKNNEPILDIRSNIKEIEYLINKFNYWKIEYNRVQQEKRNIELNKASAQIAHDIRSPLAALNVVSQSASELPEELRLIIRNAIQRINDIANNLLIRYKNRNSEKKEINLIKSKELVVTVIDDIISEKRILYKDKQIDFKLEIVGTDSYGLFVEVQLIDFKRVLSNLIDNAVHALDSDKPQVVLMLSEIANQVLITVVDNGQGIPKDLLPSIFFVKESDRKTEGHGLGLPFAKFCIESWGGQISIESEEKQGTEVKIILPKAFVPAWFAKEINFVDNMTIAILDDDISIHNVWYQRFNRLISQNNVKLINFYRAEELRNWYKSSQNDKTLFLVDYELVEHLVNGINIIEQLNIVNKSLLVTSHFEDIAIRSCCEKIGLKIVPKSFAPYIPIVRVSNKI